MRTYIIVLTVVAAVVFLFLPAGCAEPETPAAPLPPPGQPPVLTTSTGVPPRTAILEGPAGIINYNTLTFTWSGADDKTPADKLVFSSFLEGYDPDWTAYTSETRRDFGKVPNGSYTFYVKAQDDEGNIEKEPGTRRFTISGTAPIQLPEVVVANMGNFILVGSDVSRIAVANDGFTVYALDSMNSRLYRSNSAGAGWFDISRNVGAGPPWVDVAVAPDNPALVAVITNGGREVYISDDSGATFNSLGLSSVVGAGQFATCLAISPDYGVPKRDLAVGTFTGAGTGRVFINILSRFSSGWIDAGAGSPGWVAADIFALEFSPSYAADGTLLCCGSTAAKTYLYMAVRDLGSTNAFWNTMRGYPVELCNPGAGTPGTPLRYADISLPADYNGSTEYSRDVYVSWSRNHPSQDIYHVVDFQAYRMNAPEPVASIAYWGSIARGKMLAGAVRAKPDCNCAFVQTYFTANPMSVCPSCPMWQHSQKPPTGQYNARVAWSPDGRIAYAGTTGIESAFSHSITNGYTWNQ